MAAYWIAQHTITEPAKFEDSCANGSHDREEWRSLS
jgi:hypothetical protein